ncbi:hypothetical protein M0Q50_02710 [bacterium]|jgi:hypothetical protein|nr:hypothetical protein [bacterium]
MKKITTDDFINRSKNIHGDKYDYSLVEYNGMHEKVKMICKTHGIFEVTPNVHMIKKCVCKKCSKDLERTSLKEFIDKSNKIHNNKYDYSLSEYVDDKTKVEIICPFHGSFLQSPNSHICKKSGCPKCKNEKLKLSIIDFINRSNNIHGDKYDYSLVEYNGINTKVKIICKEHGIFEQKPINHIHCKCGCPKYKLSKGEIDIIRILEEKNISYIRQKKFDDCKNILPLKYDFYLPDFNIYIEFNGKQHYEIVKYWGGEDGYNIRIKRDEIKEKYCKENNIKLINIKYDDNIKQLLYNFI